MNFTVLTIFPEMFNPFWEHGVIGRALEGGAISASTLNIRDYAEGRHKTTDDRPYGGGSGMVLKPEPLARAIEAARSTDPEARVILTTPQGRVFDQKVARELSEEKSLIMVCGRYEGIDERVCGNCIDDEVSIGDYVLTGGELAVMVIMDAVARLIPGTLGGADSAEKDSFSEDLLEHAHYTRPPVFEGEAVPDVLLSGNHAEIDKWRLENSVLRTLMKRRDLLDNRKLSEREMEVLGKWRLEIEKIIQAQAVHSADTSPGGQ